VIERRHPNLVDAALLDQERRVLAAAPIDIDRPVAARRSCECCGGKLRTNNRIGYCKRTPECVTAGQAAWRERIKRRR
jgi:hypothetical protein